MSRYKTYREPRKRGYDDENFTSPDRNRQPSASYSTRAIVEAPVVEATVSWFNADKGFGFVKTADGSDAFLHIRALEAAGHSSIPEGTRLQVKIERARRARKLLKCLRSTQALLLWRDHHHHGSRRGLGHRHRVMQSKAKERSNSSMSRRDLDLSV